MQTRPIFPFVLCFVLSLIVAPAWAATRTVTNAGDGGAGSLRATIAAAASGDTVVFSNVIDTIVLTSGELVIAKNLTINGPGAKLLTVLRANDPATPAFRIFNVTGGTVAISGLTISGGRFFGADNGVVNGGSGQGGGIRNAGTLTLTNCALTGNQATGGFGMPICGPGEGGGIYNAGTLKLSGCTLSGN